MANRLRNPNQGVGGERVVAGYRALHEGLGRLRRRFKDFARIRHVDAGHAEAGLSSVAKVVGEDDRREALGEDSVVDRAVGVIIAQRGCGAHEAYTVLQQTAQRLGLDRRVVAERLIAAAARNAT